MISKDSLKLVQEAIKIFDKLEGKEYLLAFASSKKQPLSFIRIRIIKNNFWHLLGCKLDNADPSILKEKYYDDCLLERDITQALSYTNKKSDVNKKYSVFKELFNFVEKAQGLRICIADTFQIFEVGSGSIKGIIGYAKVNNSSKWYFPKTTLSKSIYDIDKNTNNKIFFILSKTITGNTFNKLEYEIAKGVFEQRQEEIDVQLINFHID